jgi:hypothetical protein
MTSMFLADDDDDDDDGEVREGTLPRPRTLFPALPASRVAFPHSLPLPMLDPTFILFILLYFHTTYIPNFYIPCSLFIHVDA